MRLSLIGRLVVFIPHAEGSQINCRYPRPEAIHHDRWNWDFDQQSFMESAGVPHLQPLTPQVAAAGSEDRQATIFSLHF
ncbi:hypothetical protein M5K25_023413 [Dendrobium thyrsiflorum]|uniref:Secreted protein n=1 Tax=Dendrobium thyrsiflorum TaxID=117978 RepID=A0ABD0UF33_DENTH